MTLSEALERIKKQKPSALTDDELIAEVNQLEAVVQQEIFDFLFEDIRQYTVEDMEEELLIYKPFDEVYTFYVAAKIDSINEEYNSYNANMAFFNNRYKDFRAHHRRNNKDVKIVSLKNYY